jgi:hypothetical protein
VKGGKINIIKVIQVRDSGILNQVAKGSKGCEKLSDSILILREN